MTRARPLSLPHLPVLVATLAICGAAAYASSPSPERVVNGDTPDHGLQTLTLEERWRRGGEEDDLFFGLVVSVLTRDDSFYLLDTQLNEVIVLDGDGEHTATLGREGEGPGEFSRSGALAWMPDATLGVVQRFPGRIVKLALDGTPAGTVLPSDPAAGGRDMLSGAHASADGLVLCGAHMTRRGETRVRRSFLSLYGPDASPRVEYMGRDEVFDFQVQSFREVDSDFVSNGRWDVTPQGRVVTAPERDRYVLMIHDTDGAPLIEATRPAEPPLRSRERLDTMEARDKAGRRYQRTGIAQEFSPSDPMIRVVDARPDGEVWVLPTEGTRPADDGIFQTWDVFTAAGRWDRSVSLACPGDPERDRLFLLDDGHALMVSGFQDARDALIGEASDDEDFEDAEPMEVILYEIR